MNMEKQKIGGIFKNIAEIVKQANGPKPHKIMEGDWMCLGCQNVNFAKRNECHKCQDKKPIQTIYFYQDNQNYSSNKVEFKQGDWYCNGCNFLNFANRDSCKNCKEYK